MSEQKRLLVIGNAAIGGDVAKALMLTENMDRSDVIILDDNLSGLNSLK